MVAMVQPMTLLLSILSFGIGHVKLSLINSAACALLVSVASFAGTAQAAGCLKGAAVGGVAGHYAHHHAVIGAVGGCLVGRHMAKRHAQEVAAQQHAAMQPGQPVHAQMQ